MTRPATSPNEPAAQPATRRLLLAGLLLLTAVVYGRVVRFDFVNFDDDVHVYQNPYVTGGLTAANVRWAFAIHGPSQWHPLAWLSHQSDVELFGLWPGGHHLTNLLWHVGNVLLLFVFLTRLTGCAWRSAFVAALLAVHPLNVESVAWVSERRNVLCLFFSLLTMIAYVWYVRRRNPWRYLLVLLLFSLALMSKPLAVTLPCLLLLLDYWPLGRTPWSVAARLQGHSEDAPDDTSSTPLRTGGVLVFEKIPLLMLSAGASLLTVWCQEGVIATTQTLPIHLRGLNALAAYGIYLRQMVWPGGLAVFYPHPGLVADDPVSELAWPAAWGGLLAAAVTCWTLATMRRRPYLAVGWFWFLGTLVPMIGLVQVGQQQIADRYAYLPLIGIFIALAWWLPGVIGTGRRGGPGLRFLAAAVIAGYAVVSWMQVGYWRDSVALFERALAVTERNSWAHLNLGLALHERGAAARAVQHYAAALQIDPEYGLARYNVGIVLHDQQNVREAIPQFQEAVRLMPWHVGARHRLGVALADLGLLDAAVGEFQQAVEIDPAVLESHLNLGLALSRLGKHREANASFERALDLDPGNVRAHYSLAIGLAGLGRHAEAERRFVRLLEIAPGFALAHNEFGKLLLETGDRRRAITHFREALRFDPRFVEAEHNLQRALIE